MYIKYFVNSTLIKSEFVNLLNQCGIAAVAVDDGILLDHDAFRAVPPPYLPHWVYLHRNDINSKLHTRPATMREFRDAQGHANGIKLVGVWATSAFGGWEFGQDGHDMYCRFVHGDYYVGEWELINDYDIADDECSIIYHLRGGVDVSSADIMRVQ